DGLERLAVTGREEGVRGAPEHPHLATCTGRCPVRRHDASRGLRTLGLLQWGIEGEEELVGGLDRGLGVADLAGKGHGAADQRPPPPTVAGRLGTRGEGQVGVYALERARRRVAISPLAPDAPLLSAGGDRRGSGSVHTGEREEGGRSRPRTVTQFFCQS